MSDCWLNNFLFSLHVQNQRPSISGARPTDAKRSLETPPEMKALEFQSVGIKSHIKWH